MTGKNNFDDLFIHKWFWGNYISIDKPDIDTKTAYIGRIKNNGTYETKEYILIKDVLKKFRNDEMFKKMSKKERLIYNRTYLNNLFKNNDSLKEHYKKCMYYDNACSVRTHCLLNIREK